MKELFESSYLSAMSNANQELRERINKVINYMENYIKVEDCKNIDSPNYNVKCEFEYVINMLKGE